MILATSVFVESAGDWVTITPGIRRKLLGYDATLMMTVVQFDAGAAGALHDHPHRQATYVADGEFEITIGGEKRTLHAGDGFFIPSGERHSAKALTAGTLVDVFAPAREDFIK